MAAQARSRRVVPLTLDNVSDLQQPCLRCLVWQGGGDPGAAMGSVPDPAFEVEAWVSATLLARGACGRVAYDGGTPVAHALAAPGHLFPGSRRFPTSPASPDALLLGSFRVSEGHRGRGFGRTLVQAVARDAAQQRLAGVEAFGHEPVAGRPACVLPAGFLRAVGFRDHRPHPVTPLLRLDLRSTLTWRNEVEAALERLLSGVGPGTLAPA